MVMSLGSARRARAMGCAAAILRDQRRVLPPQIVESFLAQSAAHPTLWRILTVWRSREALEQIRQSGETPAGVLIRARARGAGLRTRPRHDRDALLPFVAAYIRRHPDYGDLVDPAFRWPRGRRR